MPEASFSHHPAILLPLAWCLSVVVLAGPLCLTHTWLRNRGYEDERVLLAAPLVVLGLSGYVTFFAYYIHPLWGRGFAVAVGIATWAYATSNLLRRPPPKTANGLALPGKVAFAVGLFYLALLYLPQLSETFDTQSSSRFVGPLPPDAVLPEILGNLLYLGKPLRPFLGDWLSSDRPPLQAGLYLLVLPWLRLLGLPSSLGYQCVGTFAQMLWVPAVWLLCRCLGLNRLKCFWTVLAMAVMGLFTLNSTFVWPKLLAASYTVCASLLLLTTVPNQTTATGLVASASAALGFLAHGSTAFALIGLIPIWFWHNRPSLRHLPSLFIVFVLVLLPWWLYQKFGDPPGDRLLKWHLAGVIPIDGRDFITTLREAYVQLTWNDWWTARWSNLGIFMEQPFHGVFDVFTTDAKERRASEFFHGARALGVLNLAWIVAFLNRRPAHRGDPAMNVALARALGIWTLITFAVWMLLMFQHASTYVHQSSLSMFVVAAALAVIVLLHAPRILGMPLLAWHVVYFLVTWLPYESPVTGDFGMIAGLVLAVLMLTSIGWKLASCETKPDLLQRTNPLVPLDDYPGRSDPP